MNNMIINHMSDCINQWTTINS